MDITGLEQNRPPSPSPLDGLRVQMMAKAAAQSLQTNRPVEISCWEPE